MKLEGELGGCVGEGVGAGLPRQSGRGPTERGAVLAGLCFAVLCISFFRPVLDLQSSHTPTPRVSSQHL